MANMMTRYSRRCCYTDDDSIQPGSSMTHDLPRHSSVGTRFTTQVYSVETHDPKDEELQRIVYDRTHPVKETKLKEQVTRNYNEKKDKEDYEKKRDEEAYKKPDQVFVWFKIVFTTLTKYMEDQIWKTYGTTKTGTPVENIKEVVGSLLPMTAISAFFNEHAVCFCLMHTILLFSIFKGFDAMGEILGGFLHMTMYWGNAAIVGTATNIVIAGMSEQQGHRISFCRWMTYGIPIAVTNVLFVTWFLEVRYLSQEREEEYTDTVDYSEIYDTLNKKEHLPYAKLPGYDIY